MSGSTVVPVDYNWTVFVAPAGLHPGIAGLTTARDPHPGTLIDYELAPGGALSEDPAIDYETVGAEPIFNVYQTLITYNGTATGPSPDDFVPELATCVPGSPQCQALYKGDSLQSGSNYTFVIQSNASFYDPATGVHWGVYPTDVLFSIDPGVRDSPRCRSPRRTPARSSASPSWGPGTVRGTRFTGRTTTPPRTSRPR